MTSLRRLYVDEYQDVNPAQVNLAKAMISEGGARVVGVGDDLQCIYHWRGSDVGRIVRFVDDMPGTVTFRLENNYRFRVAVVEVANSIASTIELRDPEKVMLPTRPNPNVPVIRWLSTASEEEQAASVSELVQGFIRGGVPEGAIAILLRSVIGAGQLIVDRLSLGSLVFPSLLWALSYPPPDDASEPARFSV